MEHRIKSTTHNFSSVVINCTCGANFTGNSYEAEYNDVNERQALGEFRSHVSLQARMAIARICNGNV